METETLDKLFLELFQLEQGIKEALRHLRDAMPRNGPVIRAIAILEETLLLSRHEAEERKHG